MKFFEFLSGKKTYLIAFVLSSLSFLVAIGKMDQHTYETIRNLLAPAGLVTLRMAMNG